MAVRFKIRVDRRASAKADYRWLRACGWSRRFAFGFICRRYGW